ncbi:MAG: DNA alkylation repair protein [Gallionellaceae bacterium]|jgi:3-methyladenine DNA glycosylase AlkD
MRIKTIQSHLRGLSNPVTAVALQRYFKTAPGEYGAGDIFLGIKVPVLRAQLKTFRATELTIIADLLSSSYHEERLFALMLLLDSYQRGNEVEKQQIYELYLANTVHINNWDLVDSSAPRIVGHYLVNKPRDILYQLSASTSLWERRIAILATFYFVGQKDFSDSFKLAKILLQDPHDLIHKALGWMLREIGKRDLAEEEKFLQQHYAHMPRTMLRYAIERFSETRRQSYLRGEV